LQSIYTRQLNILDSTWFFVHEISPQNREL
jgi:hypothetical protein